MQGANNDNDDATGKRKSRSTSRSTSKSPMRPSLSAGRKPSQSARSLTPPTRSASPVAGRRRMPKRGASIRDPDKTGSTSPKGGSKRTLSASGRMPKAQNAFTGIDTGSGHNKQLRRAQSLSIRSDGTASSGKISARQPKRKVSVNSEFSAGNRSDSIRTAPVRRNSLGNDSASGIKGPTRINSLQPQSSSTQTPRPPLRMNSLGNPSVNQSQRLRTTPPAKRNSNLGPSPTATTSAIGSVRQLKKDPSSASMLRVKSPSIRNNSDTKTESPQINNGNETPKEPVKENSFLHLTRLNKMSQLKRWGFGGGHVSDDELAQEYGESAELSLNSDKAPGDHGNYAQSDDNSSEWDSDADDEYMMRRRGGDAETANLPPPDKRKERQKRNLENFPDDKWWQKCLRHFRILPPVPNEGRTRRSVRRSIWATLVFDVLVAIVTIATFSGTVTMCCNQATMATIPTIDWNLFIKVVSYIYLVGIFLEIHPVVREGPIPWNLLNPIFGSLLSFAVFVDDSKAEAIGIWLLEITSVVLEAITYRKLRKLYYREERRLEKLDIALKGDQDELVRKGGQYKKNAYLRERRILRKEHAESKSKLRYHFVGTTVNFILVGLTLLLMVLVARGRGMCLVAGEGLDLFHPDQRSRCFECADKSDGWKERCQVCKEGPNEDPLLNDPIQCFYPYF